MWCEGKVRANVEQMLSECRVNGGYSSMGERFLIALQVSGIGVTGACVRMRIAVIQCVRMHTSVVGLGIVTRLVVGAERCVVG